MRYAVIPIIVKTTVTVGVANVAQLRDIKRPGFRGRRPDIFQGRGKKRLGKPKRQCTVHRMLFIQYPIFIAKEVWLMGLFRDEIS